MNDTVQTMLNRLAELAPNVYLQAAVIVAVSLLLAKLADVIMTRVVSVWTARTNTTLDEQFVAILHRPVFITVMLIGLALATVRLPMGETATRLTLAMLKTIGIWIWVVFALRFARMMLVLLSGLPESFRFVQPRTLPLFQNTVAMAIFAVAVYVVFLAWEIDVTAWLASAGIIGLALSFAAKDTLANLFAGVSILVDAPYKVGDFVVLDSGERGQITHIGIRSSRMLTRDDVEITVPNSILASNMIINETGGPHEKYRIRVKVGVAYGSDIDKVRRVLLEVAAAHDFVCDHPEARVRFREFGDSSLNFELLCWVDEPVLRGRALDALNCAVYKRFAAEEIEIPFPQSDVHIKQLPGQAGQ